jgi:hypothetical protein
MADDDGRQQQQQQQQQLHNQLQYQAQEQVQNQQQQHSVALNRSVTAPPLVRPLPSRPATASALSSSAASSAAAASLSPDDYFPLPAAFIAPPPISSTRPRPLSPPAPAPPPSAKPAPPSTRPATAAGGATSETFKRRMSNEGGGDVSGRRASFGAGSYADDVGKVHVPVVAPLLDAAAARLSLEPQSSTTGRLSAAGLSKTPMLPAAGGGSSLSSSITPAAIATATPTSDGPVVSPAVTAAILAGVAPAAERDAQMKVQLLQSMIQQWAFLLARYPVLLVTQPARDLHTLHVT